MPNHSQPPASRRPWGRGIADRKGSDDGHSKGGQTGKCRSGRVFNCQRSPRTSVGQANSRLMKVEIEIWAAKFSFIY
jgi:hypothetical protein